MINIIDDFKSKIITIAETPDSGKTALLIKVIKDSLMLKKKVLFFSFQISKDLMIKRMKIESNKNLIALDKFILPMEDLSGLIKKCDLDLLVIDSLEISPNINEVIKILKNISVEKDIPIIITVQLNNINNNLDLTNIDLDMFVSHNKNMNSIINKSDVFYILYHKQNKKYMLKQLKSISGNTQEIDIRKFLN